MLVQVQVCRHLQLRAVLAVLLVLLRLVAP
jgi:hypothetical protein